MHLARRHWVRGLPLIGLLLGAGWVLGGPLPWPILVFLPLALVGSVIAFVVGVRWSKSNRPLRRLGSGLLIAGLFVLAFSLSIGAKRLWTNQGVRQLPVLADASNRHEFHFIASGDGYPDYMLYYETELAVGDAAEALQNEFSQEGWTVAKTEGLTGNVSQAYCTRGGVRVVCQLSSWTGKTVVHIQHQDAVVSLAR